jgi:hypothetical protein
LRTEHVSRSLFQAEYFLVLQSVAEFHEQPTAALQAINGVAVRDLQAAGQRLDVEPPQAATVDLAGLVGVATKKSRLEHLQTSHSKALTPAIETARLFAAVLPLCTRAGVEKHGDEEEINETAGALLVVDCHGP